MAAVEYKPCECCGVDTLHSYSDNHEKWYCVFSWTHEEVAKMMENAYEKVSYKKFDLDYFIEKYDFTEEDCEDFKLGQLEKVDGILLQDLFVKENYRGMGYGKRVVDELKRKGKSIIVYSLFEATAFWESQGFREYGGSDYVYKWEAASGE